MAKLHRGRLHRIVHFLREDVWHVQLRTETGPRRTALALLRIALHVLTRFSRNVAKLQAAGLTLVSLLALVPMLAVAFTIASALGYGRELDDRVRELAANQPAQFRDIVEQLRQLVQHTNLGAIGAIGTAIVLWSGLVLFARMEQAFNHVWRSSHRRPWLRRLTDFVALLVLVPPLALGALTLGSFLSGARMIDSVRVQLPWLGSLYEAGLGFVPHAMAWIALTVLYKLMPSARVRWTAAIAGGVIAGSGAVFLHDVHFRFQVGVARANAIYATFASLPLLLIYLQLLWTVVLVGAEVSYAVQNLATLRGTEDLPPPTPAVRRRLAWHLVQHASDGFRAGRRGVRASDLAMELDVPGEWLESVGDDLLRSGLLVQVLGDDDLVMPARPPEQITVPDVLAAAEGMTGHFLERVRLQGDSERALSTAEQDARRSLAVFSF